MCIGHTDTQNIQANCLVWQAALTSSSCVTLGKSGSNRNTSDTNCPKDLCGFIQFIQANVRKLLKLGYENFLPNPLQFIIVITPFKTTQTVLLAVSLSLRLLMSYIYMELQVKPEMLMSYIYGPTFGNAETVSFYLLHNVSTLNQCREVSCVTFVCKHFAS